MASSVNAAVRRQITKAGLQGRVGADGFEVLVQYAMETNSLDDLQAILESVRQSEYARQLGAAHARRCIATLAVCSDQAVRC